MESESCCDVVYALADWITGAQVYNTYVNEHGHTILDNLMISIIKSHTSAKPVVVDDNFKDVARFVGEEVDICGRWDADSLAYASFMPTAIYRYRPAGNTSSAILQFRRYVIASSGCSIACRFACY